MFFPINSDIEGGIKLKENYKVFTTDDGTVLHYLDIGKGKPLLYVHGFGGSSEVLLPLFKELENDFRCICFDQRGYGQTEAKGEIGLYQSAKDAKALIEHLDLEDVVFLGYSMGAGVLFAYLDLFKTKYLERLIIGDMSPKLVNDESWRLGLYQGWYEEKHLEKDLTYMKNAYEKFGRYFILQTLLKQTPDLKRSFQVDKEKFESICASNGVDEVMIDALLNISDQQKRSNRLYWQSMCQNDFRETLSDIDVPTALIYAIPGSIYRPEVAKFMNRQIRQSKLYPFSNCSHMLSREKAASFIDTIKTFAFE